MTTRQHDGMAYGAAFRDDLLRLAGLPAVVNLTNIRVDEADGTLRFDATFTESVSHTDSAERMCACGCGVMFFPARPKQIYRTDNCRLKAFRAAKRAELDATNTGAPR